MFAKVRRRLPLRFTLRTLLIVLTIACVYGGWRIEQARQQMLAVGKLNQLVFYPYANEVSEEQAEEPIEEAPAENAPPTEADDPFGNVHPENPQQFVAKTSPPASEDSLADWKSNQIAIYYNLPDEDSYSHNKLEAHTESYLRIGTAANDNVIPHDLWFHLRYRATAVEIHGPLTPELFALLRSLPHLRFVLRNQGSCLNASDEERAAEQEFVDRVKRELPRVQFRDWYLAIVG